MYCAYFGLFTKYTMHQDLTKMETLFIKTKKRNNMENRILLALTEFTLNNYQSLKEEYNKLTREQKQTTPITIYIIKTFDTLLNNSKNELKEINPEDNTPT